MKKHLLLLSLVSIAISAFGQNSIPNGNFETWISGTYELPQNYPNSSNSDAFFRYQLPFNVVKTTPANSGNFAVKLTTVASATDTLFSYFVNTNPDGPATTWTGGMPYDQKPTGIRGYYKYNVATADSGTVFAAFSKAGVNIGTYFLSIGGIHNTYALFDLTFNPPLPATPDSVIFGALSCKFNAASEQPGGPAGSILILDNVSFTGVSSQPLLLNGDFEAWESQTLSRPAEWIAQNNPKEGLAQTSDAHAGNFALELKTYLGSDENGPAAQPGQISSGYWDNSCNCMNGGHAFSNQEDTLVFWYKYVPASTDKAFIALNFKKNGITMGWAAQSLSASTDYQYFELPFYLNQVPDTVIVVIQSSETTDLSFVGSDLKIDDIHFKSQPINVSVPLFSSPDQLSIFPNPTDGKFTITSATGIKQLKVFNLLGEVIYTKNNSRQVEQNEIDLSKSEKGIYFIGINDGTRVYTRKITLK